MKISRDSVELNEILKHNADDLLSDFNEEKLSYNTNLLTEQSDDEYLNNRGEDYLEALTINKEFRERLGRLDFKLIDEVYIKKYFNNYCIKERNKELESINREIWGLKNFEQKRLDKDILFQTKGQESLTLADIGNRLEKATIRKNELVSDLKKEKQKYNRIKNYAYISSFVILIESIILFIR